MVGIVGGVFIGWVEWTKVRIWGKEGVDYVGFYRLIKSLIFNLWELGSYWKIFNS